MFSDITLSGEQFKIWLASHEPMLYAAWGILALGFLICLCIHKNMQIPVIGAVLLAATAIFCPLVFYANGSERPLMNILIAGHKAVRLFLVEEDFQEFLTKMTESGIPEDVLKGYQITALALFVAAPITAITSIAFYMRNFSAHVSKAFRGVWAQFYAFSELNEKSLALAEDIHRKHRSATIAFYDVYRKNEETNAELIERADKLRALCFRNDILHLRLFPYWRKKVLFIIGENEPECLNQAIQLTKKYQKRRNIKVYVWAQSPESEAVLDSLQKNRKERNGFVLRRIHDAQIFAWNLLQEADLFRVNENQRRETLSILLVGMGRYGKEILKTAIWMYQIDDMKLEINVVDASDTVQASLRHECPELLQMNENEIPGEAHYSIRFFENTNIFQGGLENILFSTDEAMQEQKERLTRTDVVFVTLGDDDTNIRAAIELRTMFDRVHYRSNFDKLEQIARDAEDEIVEDKKAFGAFFCEQEQHAQHPQIYTPVYDAVKAENITLSPTSGKKGWRAKKRGKKAHTPKGLCCVKGIPYHIHFKGSFREQYAYDAITRQALEAEALKYHLHWSTTREAIKENTRLYEQYEYYRRSSMAQAIHKATVSKLLPLSCLLRTNVPAGVETPGVKDCQCANCMRIRKIEHMRWNAYMRTEGYCAPTTDGAYKVKLERAKLHVNLTAFKELDKTEKKLDSTVAS